MRRSHSVSETSVGLFAFLDVLMSTMGSLILVLMIVSPKIRQEKMAQAAKEAARDIVKVEPAPAPVAIKPVAPVVAPPRETIDLNARFATRVAELSSVADDKRRAAAEKEQSLAAERESSQKIRAQREQLERELAELRATKDHTVASAQDLSAEGLKVETELAKRGSRLRKIQDQIAHESTEYEFAAYDGVSGTTRRPILIECSDEKIKFPQENITLTSSDTTGYTSSANPLLAGAQALLDYWLTHSKADDPKPYVLIVVRPSGTMAYYRARNLLKRMKSPFGYELLAEDQKLAVPAPNAEAVAVCRRAIDQAVAKRESVFDQALAGGGSGMNPRTPLRSGSGGSRSDVPGGTGNGGKTNSPFDDPFDLTSGGSKGTGNGPGGDSLVAAGTAMKGGSVAGSGGTGSPGAAGSGPGGVASGSPGPNGVGAGGVSASNVGWAGPDLAAGGPGNGPGGTGSGGAGSAGLGSGGNGSFGAGSTGTGSTGTGSAATGTGSGTLGGGGLGAGAMGSGGGNSGAAGSGGLAAAGPGGELGGGGSSNLPTNGANGESKNGSEPNGSEQKGSDQKGSGGGAGNPIATLAGPGGADTVVGGAANPGAEGLSGTPQSNPAFELLPPPGAIRTGAPGDGKAGQTAAAGDLGLESALGAQSPSSQSPSSQSPGSQSPSLQGPDSPAGRASLGLGSAPTTPLLQAGAGGSQPGSQPASPDGGIGGGGSSAEPGTSGVGGGGGGGGSDQTDASAAASGQPGSPQFSPAGADNAGEQGESGLPGGSPAGGGPGADSQGEPAQSSSASADQPAAPGAGMPSFRQTSDDAPNGNVTKHRWGYSTPQANIGFEHDVTIWIGAHSVVVGGQPPVSIDRAESSRRLAALVVPALDREARAWGRPPEHLYWVPNVKFVVSPGGNLSYERLRPVIEQHGLISSVDYCLEMESPRQTFQSWVQ